MTPIAVPARNGAAGRLRRLEGEFLRPHGRTILLALAGMFASALLLLPVPVVQGRVLDRLVAAEGADSGGPPPALAAEVLGALAVSACCLLGRVALGWKVAAAMTRVSLEVVRALTDA